MCQKKKKICSGLLHMSYVSTIRNQLLALIKLQLDSFRMSHKNNTISEFPSCRCSVSGVAGRNAKLYPWENSCFVHQRTGMGNRNSVLTLCCQCGYGRHLTRVIYCLTYSISYSQLGNYTSLSIISKWGGVGGGYCAETWLAEQCAKREDSLLYCYSKTQDQHTEQ